jgi:hypothetical protein
MICRGPSAGDAPAGAENMRLGTRERRSRKQTCIFRRQLGFKHLLALIQPTELVDPVLVFAAHLDLWADTGLVFL